MSAGGLLKKKETLRATTKLMIIPIKPNPSGDIPKNQLSAEFK